MKRLHPAFCQFVSIVTTLSFAACTSAAPFVTAVGSGGVVLRSNDGGTNWNPQQSGFNRELFAVDFVDSQTGWTSGMFQSISTSERRITMRYTIDGGSAWRSADFVVPIQNTILVHDIDFIDSNNGWMVGGTSSTKNIWHSVDGGLTWSPQVSGESNDLFAVDFVNANVGWAVGSGGLVVKTTDGGDTWNVQRRASLSITGADFVDESLGWAVGPDLNIIHTTDGGSAWTTQPSVVNGQDTDPRDVIFVSETTGWVVGAEGVILHTSNGGDSWEAQNSGTTTLLNAVDFLDENIGWAIGEAGTILHTTDGGTTWIAQFSGTTQTLQDIVAVVPEPTTLLLGAMASIGLMLRRRCLIR